jgi:hypothetical protein
MIIKMPKVRQDLSVKFDNYVKEFGNVLKKSDNNLICMACRKQIKSWEKKKYYIKQHFQTHSHCEAMKRYNNGDIEEEISLSTNRNIIIQFNNYIKEYENMLSTDGNDLFCNACNKQIRNAHKRSILLNNILKHNYTLKI